MVRQKLDLAFVGHYALFLVKDGLPKRLPLAEPVLSFLGDDHNVQQMDSSPKLLFRPWIYVHGGRLDTEIMHGSLDERNPSQAVYLAYTDAVYMLASGRYQLTADEAVLVGCLKTQVQSGDYDPAIHTREYGSRGCCCFADRWIVSPTTLCCYQLRNIRERIAKQFPHPVKAAMRRDGQNAALEDRVLAQYARLVRRLHINLLSECSCQFVELRPRRLACQRRKRNDSCYRCCVRGARSTARRFSTCNASTTTSPCSIRRRLWSRWLPRSGRVVSTSSASSQQRSSGIRTTESRSGCWTTKSTSWRTGCSKTTLACACCAIEHSPQIVRFANLILFVLRGTNSEQLNGVEDRTPFCEVIYLVADDVDEIEFLLAAYTDASQGRCQPRLEHVASVILTKAFQLSFAQARK